MNERDVSGRDRTIPMAGAADADALRAENAALRARVAELERRDGHALLRAIVDNSAAIIFVKDPDGRIILINRRFEDVFHIGRAEVLGKTDHDMAPPDIADRVRANDLAAVVAGTAIEIEELMPHDDGLHTYLSLKFPIYDAEGALLGVGGIATDITERKRAAHQQEIIDAQQASLRELSTPIIPLDEGVLVMPLIGAIDGARAGMIMEVLLDGISAQRAKIAILDITGVKVVDTEVANALIRAAQAARLLGAEVILTGIAPAVAMSLVELDADLGGVVTLGTLRAGIAYALSR